MTTASAKQKGRSLQNSIRDLIIKYFPILTINDVKSTSMGVSGMDIQLSELARKHFPYSVEAKCQEKLNIWDALKQSESNADGLTPVVIFKRNRSKTYVCLELDNFMKIITKK